MKLKSFIAIMCLCLCLCSCGEKKAPKNDSPADNRVTSSAEDSAKNDAEKEYADEETAKNDRELISLMLDCYINSDYEGAMEYIRESDRSLFNFGDENQTALYDCLLSKISYEVGEDYYSGGRHYITTEITAPDMLDIYGKINLQYIDAMMNGEVFSAQEARDFNNKTLKEITDEGDYETKTMTVDIELQKDESGEEKAVFTAELMNAMLGDITTAQSQVSQAIEEGMEEYNSAKESGALD